MCSQISHNGSMLTIRQAAKRLFGDQYNDTDVNRIYRMLKNNRMKASIIGGRKFIPVSVIEEIEQKNETN